MGTHVVSLHDSHDSVTNVSRVLLCDTAPQEHSEVRGIDGRCLSVSEPTAGLESGSRTAPAWELTYFHSIFVTNVSGVLLCNTAPQEHPEVRGTDGRCLSISGPAAILVSGCRTGLASQCIESRFRPRACYCVRRCSSSMLYRAGWEP